MRWAKAALTPRLLMMAGLSANESLVTLERASIVVGLDWIERWERRWSLERIVLGVLCGAVVERRRQKMGGRGSEIFWKRRNAYLRLTSQNTRRRIQTTPANAAANGTDRNPTQPTPNSRPDQTAREPQSPEVPWAGGAPDCRERTEARLVAVAQLPPRLAQQKAATLPEEDVAGKGIDEAGRNQRVLNPIKTSKGKGENGTRGKQTNRSRVDEGPQHPDVQALGAKQLGQLAHEAEVVLVGDALEPRRPAQAVLDHHGRHLGFPLVRERQDSQHCAGHLVQHLAVDVFGLVGPREWRHGGGGGVGVGGDGGEELDGGEEQRERRRGAGERARERESERAAARARA
ncbi:hypothetical protein IWX48DRAFT_594267 [Phyllosticta citricarpa]